MRYLRKAPAMGSGRRRVLLWVARFMGAAAAGPRRMSLVEILIGWIIDRLPTVKEYVRALKENDAAVVFCTHQRSLEALELTAAARCLKVPSVTFIFSWDNLTSKGRIAASFDYFLVWSDHMKQELLRYYPSVRQSRVCVVGSPQFDPYSSTSLLQRREEFFASIGADPKKPLLCYSGGDLLTAPEDADHLRVLLRLIGQGKIEHDCQVLVRPSPVDQTGRYEAVKRDFPDLIVARPRWNQVEEDWSQAIPSVEDVQFLANLTFHADININLASTMTLDFAIRDKPVVNVAFDISDPPIFGRPLSDHYYRFEHYRPVVELGAARLAHSPEELAHHLNAYLDDPSLDRDGRRALVDLEVGTPIGESGRMIWETLQEIASR